MTCIIYYLLQIAFITYDMYHLLPTTDSIYYLPQVVSEETNLNQEDLNSYRSISNLNFMSKMIECVVTIHFHKCCEAHSLLPVYQSAYRAYHSTETAVVIVHHNIMRNIEQTTM